MNRYIVSWRVAKWGAGAIVVFAESKKHAKREARRLREIPAHAKIKVNLLTKEES